MKVLTESFLFQSSREPPLLGIPLVVTCFVFLPPLPPLTMSMLTAGGGFAEAARPHIFRQAEAVLDLLDGFVESVVEDAPRV